MPRGSNVLVAGFFCLAFTLSLTKVLNAVFDFSYNADGENEVKIWLEEQNLTEHQDLFRKNGK